MENKHRDEFRLPLNARNVKTAYKHLI